MTASASSSLEGRAHEGRCLCGAVRFEVRSPWPFFAHCHCSMCRKHHGASFVTWVVARAASFEWLAGEESIRRYDSSGHLRRSWCSRCGSTVPTVLDDASFFAGVVDVPAGCLITPLEVRPDRHIFVGSKAPWVEITDALPAHEGWARPEKSPPATERPPRASRAGFIGGSCLCGGVVFEVERPSQDAAFEAMRNCHCRRCRLARGAAHATNLFASAERVAFVRGGDLIADYALPEAERFGVAFCTGCGSHVARVVPGRPYAVIPAGALDEDPGMRPSAHIFVGSKAEWFEITDELPRYEEYPR
ncbi:MAG TPA: GFA family protein [Thermoanaerobaculia bacterium]|nr:GFA family protein [Thermoanaerobaculia bacterium]